jgi:hypothetical protein
MVKTESFSYSLLGALVPKPGVVPLMWTSLTCRALLRGAHEIVLHFRLRGRRPAKICGRPLLEAVITLILGKAQEGQGVGVGLGVEDGRRRGDWRRVTCFI